MRHFLLSAVALTLSAVSLHAQQTRIFHIPLGAVAQESDMREDFNPTLQCLEMPKPAGDNRLKQIKDSLALVYPKKQHASAARQGNASAQMVPISPTVGRSIQGNGFGNSTPNDNEIAVANRGMLISAQNSTLYRYNDSAGTPLGSTSLQSWSSALGNTQSKYDPKVIYDPISDRFIVVCLAGFTDSTSSIIVGFSQTNAANGAWNLYQLPGDPLNDSLWTDYPAISITPKELFITVNLLYNNQPWQTGFEKTIIWQVNKNSGYTGQTLITQLHSGIQHNGRNVRNLHAVKGGETLYGPNMYFLSNRNLDASNDTIFLVQLTDTINAPGQQLIVTPLISPVSYWAPANAQQRGQAELLATNDARVLGAFYQDNKIHWVQNTLDTSTGYCSFLHGIISNVSSSPSITYAHIMSDTIEFGYPNIAYAGKGSTGDTAILGFLHTSANVYPGVSALLFDGSTYSSRVAVKAGQGYIHLLPGDDRWGDYSGMQRRYNAPGTVWMNGMYGHSNHAHSTWVTELATGPDVGIITPGTSAAEVNVFPNPFSETVEVTFTASQTEQLDFGIYDMQGKLVKLLLRERVKPGLNRFTCNVGPLAKGSYVLRIASPASVYATKTIIKN